VSRWLRTSRAALSRASGFVLLGKAIVAMRTPLGGFAEKAEVGLEVGIPIKLGIVSVRSAYTSDDPRAHCSRRRNI